MTLNRNPTRAIRPTTLNTNPTVGVVQNGASSPQTLSPMISNRNISSSKSISKLKDGVLVRSPRNSPVEASPTSGLGAHQPPSANNRKSSSNDTYSKPVNNSCDTSPIKIQNTVQFIKSPDTQKKITGKTKVSSTYVNNKCSASSKTDQSKNINQDKDIKAISRNGSTGNSTATANTTKNKVVQKRKKSNCSAQEKNVKFKKTNGSRLNEKSVESINVDDAMNVQGISCYKLDTVNDLQKELVSENSCDETMKLCIKSADEKFNKKRSHSQNGNNTISGDDISIVKTAKVSKKSSDIKCLKNTDCLGTSEKSGDSKVTLFNCINGSAISEIEISPEMQADKDDEFTFDSHVMGKEIISETFDKKCNVRQILNASVDDMDDFEPEINNFANDGTLIIDNHIIHELSDEKHSDELDLDWDFHSTLFQNQLSIESEKTNSSSSSTICYDMIGIDSCSTSSDTSGSHDLCGLTQSENDELNVVNSQEVGVLKPPWENASCTHMTCDPSNATELAKTDFQVNTMTEEISVDCQQSLPNNNSDNISAENIILEDNYEKLQCRTESEVKKIHNSAKTVVSPEIVNTDSNVSPNNSHSSSINCNSSSLNNHFIKERTCKESHDCSEEFIRCVFQMSLTEVTGSLAVTKPTKQSTERDSGGSCSSPREQPDDQLHGIHIQPNTATNSNNIDEVICERSDTIVSTLHIADESSFCNTIDKYSESSDIIDHSSPIIQQNNIDGVVIAKNDLLVEANKSTINCSQFIQSLSIEEIDDEPNGEKNCSLVLANENELISRDNSKLVDDHIIKSDIYMNAVIRNSSHLASEKPQPADNDSEVARLTATSTFVETEAVEKDLELMIIKEENESASDKIFSNELLDGKDLEKGQELDNTLVNENGESNGYINELNITNIPSSNVRHENIDLCLEIASQTDVKINKEIFDASVHSNDRTLDNVYRNNASTTVIPVDISSEEIGNFALGSCGNINETNRENVIHNSSSTIDISKGNTEHYSNLGSKYSTYMSDAMANCIYQPDVVKFTDSMAPASLPVYINQSENYSTLFCMKYLSSSEIGLAAVRDTFLQTISVEKISESKEKSIVSLVKKNKDLGPITSGRVSKAVAVNSVKHIKSQKPFTKPPSRSTLKLPLTNTSLSNTRAGVDGQVKSACSSPVGVGKITRRASTNSVPSTSHATTRKISCSAAPVIVKTGSSNISVKKVISPNNPRQVKRKLTATECGDKKRSTGVFRSLGKSHTKLLVR